MKIDKTKLIQDIEAMKEKLASMEKSWVSFNNTLC